MKILRVAQHLYPEVTGGAPYHVHAMSRDQAAMGHDVTVVTVSDDASLPRRETRDGYEIVRARPNFEVIGNAFAKGVWDELRAADEYDVVHAHSHLYFSSNMAAIRRRFDETQLAITNHGLFSQTAPQTLQRIYLKTLGKWTFNMADLIFCYTDGVKERFRSRGITPPIEVISNGIDPDLFSPDGPVSDLIIHEGPTILSVIRLVDGKRPKVAINAVERLRGEFPNVHLYLVGDGYLRPELEEYISNNGLSDVVTLLGTVPYDEMPKLYRSCDVFLLPSEEEAGAPRVVLESMATETPFVVTEMEHTVKTLLETGLSTPIGDIETITDSLTQIVSDKQLQDDVGTEGKKLVLDEFNWKRTVEETTKSLSYLANSKS